MSMKLKKDYQTYLNQVVDEIFAAQESWSTTEWAERSGLSESTVYRLIHRVTVLPHLRTIFRLAKAAGLRIALEKDLRVRRKAA